jgi:hypothetical protein
MYIKLSKLEAYRLVIAIENKQLKTGRQTLERVKHKLLKEIGRNTKNGQV